MVLNLSLILVFAALLFSSLKGITILYPLTAGLVLFILLSIKQGFSPIEILRMISAGIRKPSKIYEILILVGASVSLWMACGTVPYFIYHGLSFIAPEYFVVSVFILTCLMGIGIGSSVGISGIIGVVFMVMARAGGVDPNLTAGAIITAAYFCERSTPLSSCANLVAVLAETDLYGYMKKLFIGTLIPFTVTVGLYLFFSLQNPLRGDFGSVTADISAMFNLSSSVTIPALTVLLCVLFRADVRLTLGLGIVTAGVVGVMVQGEYPMDMVGIMLTGYKSPSGGAVASHLQSGGIFGMVRPIMVVIVAAAYSGIFEGTRMLIRFEQKVDALVRHFGRFSAMIVTSTIGSCFGCSQTFAIITAHQFMEPYYPKTAEGKAEEAQDIGNTAVLIPGLIPWNVAFSIPAAILAVDARCIPYAFFLYLAPLFIWGKEKLKKTRGEN